MNKQLDMFGGEATEIVNKPKRKKRFSGKKCPQKCGHLDQSGTIVRCALCNVTLAGSEDKKGNIRYTRCDPCLTLQPTTNYRDYKQIDRVKAHVLSRSLFFAIGHDALAAELRFRRDNRLETMSAN